MRIQITVDNRGCEIDFDPQGNVYHVSRWVGSGRGTMEHTRTLWSAKRKKSRSPLVIKIIEAAQRERLHLEIHAKAVAAGFLDQP